MSSRLVPHASVNSRGGDQDLRYLWNSGPFYISQACLVRVLRSELRVWNMERRKELMCVCVAGTVHIVDFLRSPSVRILRRRPKAISRINDGAEPGGANGWNNGT